jgi:hypothetical protein
MRKAILNWLGVDAVSSKGYEALGRAQLKGFRDDTHALTTAVEFLAGRLHDTVTKEEVTEELNERLKRLENAHAGALSGTKNQIRRTRRAAWLLWGFLLLIASFFTVQLHDLHIAECVITPPQSAAQDYVCTAAFPFANHESAELLHRALEATDPEAYPADVHYQHAVDPRIVGALFYSLLFGGTIVGLSRYQRTSREEENLEVGEFTSTDLDTLRAAQDDEEVAYLRHMPHSREPERTFAGD